MKAYRYAINLLGRRDYSEKMLRNKMTVKGFIAKDIEYVIRFLKDKNYLNEYRFANRQIIRLILKGYAPPLIRLHLKKMDVFASAENIDSWIEEAYEEIKITQEDQIKKLIQLRQKRYEKKEDKKLHLLRYLLSKGHDRDTCMTLLNIEFYSLDMA